MGSQKTRMLLGFRQEGSLSSGGFTWEQGLCWELDSRSFLHNLAENNADFFPVSRTLGILRIMGAGPMSA